MTDLNGWVEALEAELGLPPGTVDVGAVPVAGAGVVGAVTQGSCRVVRAVRTTLGLYPHAVDARPLRLDGDPLRMNTCTCKNPTVDTFDDIDRGIVACLRRDGRATFAEIGGAVGLSAPAAKRRVDRLRQDGAIQRFTAEVAPAALGWTIEAFVELYCEGRVPPDRMADMVATIPEVVQAWTVTGDVSRVGARLRGPALPRRVGGELASEGLVPGSVQVPGDGQPIVMLRDHPTTGGYPVIAVVDPDDLADLAQARPGA